MADRLIRIAVGTEHGTEYDTRPVLLETCVAALVVTAGTGWHRDRCVVTHAPTGRSLPGSFPQAADAAAAVARLHRAHPADWSGPAPPLVPHLRAAWDEACRG